ncbi:acyltransferase [Nocardioidaceae bacterium]|nr:acyltransferase [Nocardioidaceae bacterium]
MSAPASFWQRFGTLPVGEKASRRDIQGLRGFAVLLVLLAHAGVPGFGGGFLGVDVFFVVSGFLITGLLVREVRKTGTVSIGGFYARRARRILPAATVLLVVTVAVAALILPFVEADRIGRDALWAAFFAANIHYALQGVDYFAADLSPSAFQHFWSLAVEEQFYIVWPVLVLGLAWVAARRGRRTTAGTVGIVAAIAVVACFAWSLYATSTSPSTAYFSTLARAWEIGVGALLACVAAPLSAWLTTRRREVLAAGGMIAIVIGLASVDPTTPWPGAWALLPVLGTAAMLAAGLPHPRNPDGSFRPMPGPTYASRLIEIAPVRWIGDISYSLYLWHWPLLIVTASYLGRDLTVWEATGLMVLAVPVGAISYYLIENPWRHGVEELDLRGQRRSLVLWPAALAISVLAVQGSTWYVAAQQSNGASTVALGAPAAPSAGDGVAGADAPDAGALLTAALDVVTSDAAQQAPIPFPLGQDLLELNEDRVQFDERCTAEPDETSHDICPAGDRDAATTVVLMGDSHLNMWSPGVDRVASQAGVRVVPLIKFGCTPIDIEILRVDVDRSYTECDQWRDWSLDQIEKLQPAAVILGTHTHFQALDAGGSVIEGPARDAAWSDGVRRTAEALAPVTEEVRLLGDLNFLDQSPADCLSRRDATIGDCTFPISRTVTAMDQLAQEALEGTGAELVPLTDMLCVDGRCPLVAADLSVYRDVQHVSASWAEYAAPALWERLDLDIGRGDTTGSSSDDVTASAG